MHDRERKTRRCMQGGNSALAACSFVLPVSCLAERNFYILLLGLCCFLVFVNWVGSSFRDKNLMSPPDEMICIAGGAASMGMCCGLYIYIYISYLCFASIFIVLIFSLFRQCIFLIVSSTLIKSATLNTGEGIQCTKTVNIIFLRHFCIFGRLIFHLESSFFFCSLFIAPLSTDQPPS